MGRARRPHLAELETAKSIQVSEGAAIRLSKPTRCRQLPPGLRAGLLLDDRPQSVQLHFVSRVTPPSAIEATDQGPAASVPTLPRVP